MSARILFITAALLIALSVAWGKRQSIQTLFAPPPPSPKPIQFDNGTVREFAPSSSASSSSDRSQIASGGLRKCFKGQQISYTNMECPPGSTEKPVAGPPVNILPAQASAKSDEARAQDKAKPSLRGALELDRDVNLKDRMMERVIEGQK
jgi:hypothetical protein